MRPVVRTSEDYFERVLGLKRFKSVALCEKQQGIWWKRQIFWLVSWTWLSHSILACLM